MTREQELYAAWADKLGEDPAYREELASIREDEGEIRDRFYRDLSFGTAGLRGVLGLGCNRMNVFTVRRATQGMASFLLENGSGASVAIAYDSRNKSDLFAREAACVFAANGIRVHLYAELMPTPALSYAVRELGCDAGVVITASHNPAKYNGYKAYGPDGCQIGAEVADKVLCYMDDTPLFDGPRHMDFDEALSQGLVQYIPEAFVQQYLQRVMEESLRPDVSRKAGLKLVYTPLNGAGGRCVGTVLERMGVEDVTLVEEQLEPDGNFPTCPYPNPETREALELGLRYCDQVGADMLLATDPDCDRVAVAVRSGEGYQILTGNEVGVLLLDYICASRRELGRMPERPVAVKSIVSTPLADKVAASHGVEMVSVLTGFKFIGEVILGLEAQGEEERFLFAFEESCGYLSGGYVRDKDAVDASMLLVEMASYYKLAGKTLVDVLGELYEKHGIYRSVVDNLAFEGADGMARMAEIMETLRANPPVAFAGDKVISRGDYKTSKREDQHGVHAIPLPASNVLEYGLDNGSTLIVRPSGTEPKIKIYYTLVGRSVPELDGLEERYRRDCQERILG